jgi:cupin 2 domain-containing protein
MKTRNLLHALPPPSRDEILEKLIQGGDFFLERIVSTGQATPPGQWYDQEEDEWVLLLAGAARLRFEDEDRDRQLGPGDCLNIPSHRRHRVEWTAPGEATVWLAIHYAEG